MWENFRVMGKATDAKGEKKALEKETKYNVLCKETVKLVVVLGFDEKFNELKWCRVFKPSGQAPN